MENAEIWTLSVFTFPFCCMPALFTRDLAVSYFGITTKYVDEEGFQLIGAIDS